MKPISDTRWFAFSAAVYPECTSTSHAARAIAFLRSSRLATTLILATSLTAANTVLRKTPLRPWTIIWLATLIDRFDDAIWFAMPRTPPLTFHVPDIVSRKHSQTGTR